MDVIKGAIGDAVLTFLWVSSTASLVVVTSIIASALSLERMAALFLTTFLVFLLLLVFGVLGSALGGANFNPTVSVASLASGLGSDSLVSTSIRLPAQAAGAVGGALAILEVMPQKYKHMLGGPSLKVDLHIGAIAEGVLTFAITMAALLILFRGPRSQIVKNWLLAMTTVSLIVAGSTYTGPAMNPANAFGWAYVKQVHNTWEHFYVYWICPFVGATLAAWVFRFIFPPPVKQKKA